MMTRIAQALASHGLRMRKCVKRPRVGNSTWVFLCERSTDKLELVKVTEGERRANSLNEYWILSLLSDVCHGLAPNPTGFFRLDGLCALSMEFIPGRATDASVTDIAGVISRIRSVKWPPDTHIVGPNFRAFSPLESFHDTSYRNALQKLSVQHPWFNSAILSVKKTEEAVFAHGDLTLDHLLKPEESSARGLPLRVVDWEHGGGHNSYEDIATMLISFGWRQAKTAKVRVNPMNTPLATHLFGHLNFPSTETQACAALIAKKLLERILFFRQWLRDEQNEKRQQQLEYFEWALKTILDVDLLSVLPRNET